MPWRVREDKGTPCTLCNVSNNLKSQRFVLPAVVVAALTLCASCAELTPMDDPRVFRYNESASITSLDPAAARSLEHMWVVDQLYDGLVELTSGLDVAPCLAQAWTFDESRNTYRFELRQDAVFATGRPVSAQDVVYSLERLRDPSVVSSGRVDPRNGGGGRHRGGRQRHGRDQLKAPYPPFLGLLTTAYGSIIDAQVAQTEGHNLRNNPAGSGPFVLGWWVPDAGLVLHRNERHWERDSAGRQLPYLDAVHVDVVQDMGAEFLGLTQGRYDFISGLHPAYMETLLNEEGELQSDLEADFNLQHVPFLKTDYLGVVLDGESTPVALRDARVRRAMSLALDREEMARHLRRNAVVPHRSFCAAFHAGSNHRAPPQTQHGRSEGVVG